ncbi:hypothetical protein PFDG_01338 [Plasmodium falciparum Dd2]|uniref:rRNA adenine N(6)-methyltransferase n=1 Tax=Plasmodium falciparum (isolate Dd2) TaxID=57267 RepID=A0A0L7LYU2_PLAF4|nr:hypothetical protein PFDG_01338 [Plasmodium falciparum Dd2]
MITLQKTEKNMNVQNLESLQNDGNGVIELGCGLGQISKYLSSNYKNMTGIEIDSRALSITSRTMPGFDFIHDDVLQITYKELSINKKTKLTIIGNLPFYITSQILFCLLDFYKYLEHAIVTIQYEVGELFSVADQLIIHSLFFKQIFIIQGSLGFTHETRFPIPMLKLLLGNNPENLESFYKHANVMCYFLKKYSNTHFANEEKN